MWFGLRFALITSAIGVVVAVGAAAWYVTGLTPKRRCPKCGLRGMVPTGGHDPNTGRAQLRCPRCDDETWSRFGRTRHGYAPFLGGFPLD